MFKNLTVRDVSKLFFVLGTYAFLYYLNNYYQVFPVIKLTKSPLDGLITFSPYWIYFYLLAYLLPFFMYFHLRRNKLHDLYLSSFLALTLLTNFCFFILPTAIDRPLPDLGNTDSVTQLAFHLLYGIDQPFNCAPSTHVSTSFVAAFVVRHDRIQFPIFMGLALAISYSALAIGQHYFIDAALGLVASIVSIALGQRKSWSKIPFNSL